jgi:PTS system fructose-specific IIC component
MKFVAVTSCPTGIAHTYMAAEALEQAARGAGHDIEVETQGAGGLQALSDATIAEADAVIFAADVEVRGRDRFAGKPTVTAPVKRAINDAAGIVEEAVRAAEAGVVAAPAARTTSSGGLTTKVDQGAGVGTRVRQWLMTGVSYMIPFVAAGGIMIALGFMLARFAGGGDGAIQVTKIPVTDLIDHFDPTSGMQWAALLFQVGVAAWLLGASFITEGAIPFAAADPLRVIPSIMAGSAVTGGLVGAFGSELAAPHGGIWVTPLISGIPGYLLAIVVGTCVTAALVVVAKSTRRTEEAEAAAVTADSTTSAGMAAV